MSVGVCKCAGESGRGGARAQPALQLSLLVILSLVTNLIFQLAAADQAHWESREHDDEDLMEGRMAGAGQACGLRHPEAPATSAGHELLYIVGGDEVDDDQSWPWSVAIYELDPLNGQRGFICSGSLISDRFVLTAAHCIQQSRYDTLGPEEIFLRIAALRLDDDSAPFYQVDQVFVHPEYQSDRKANDIALLRLAAAERRRLPGRARPICLPSSLAHRMDFTDQQVTIIGWGKTSAMRGDESTRLIDDQDDQDAWSAHQKLIGATGTSAEQQNLNLANESLLQAQLKVTSLDQCNRNYSRLEIDWLNIDEHFICASDPQGKRDACQGDSGGPLMWRRAGSAGGSGEKWFQLGVISFGHGCANSNYPGVYARISYYMPWILRVVNGRRAGPRGHKMI